MIKTDQRGVVLLELVLYLGICSIVISGAITLLFSLQKLRVKGEVIAEINSQSVHVLQTLQKDIWEATEITEPSPGNSGGSLELVMLDSDKNPTVYKILNNSLTVKYGTDAPLVLLTNSVDISNLQFKNKSKPNTLGIIKVSYTLGYNSLSNRNEYSYVQDYSSSISIR